MNTNTKNKLEVEFDEKTDTIYIEGVAYSADIFRKMSLCNIGTWFRIESRERDGIVIYTPSQSSHKLIDAITARL